MSESVPCAEGLRVLDEAHAESFPVFLREIGHDPRRARDRARAQETLTGLYPSLLSNEGPNYLDPYVAAAYLVEYHLEHIMLGYWAFRGLFDQVGVPDSLYVLDFAAGTGAGRVGLAIALAELDLDVWPAVCFHSFDVSRPMLTAGDCFWQSFRERMPWARNFECRDFGALPARTAIPEGSYRIVTGFHPTLPYDSAWWGESSAAMRSLRAALDLVSPQAELFSCLEQKSSALSSVLAGFSEAPEEFEVPDSRWALGGNSSVFYDRVAKEAGFDFGAGKTPVTRRGGYRFGFPKKSILYRRISLNRVSVQEERRRPAVSAAQEERKQSRVASWREERSRQQRAAARDSLARAEELRRSKEEWERTEARFIREAEQRAAAPSPKPKGLKRIIKALFG